MHFVKESPLPIHSVSNTKHEFATTTPAVNLSAIPSELATIDYFQKRNVKLTEQVQKYVRLTRHLKHDNGILKSRVTSLKKLVDDMTESNGSLRKQLKKKERQLEEIMKSQPKPIPSFLGV